MRLPSSNWSVSDRNFLLGDADHYDGIPPRDLRTQIKVLDRAHAAGLKVVLTPPSLPDDRWIQQNGNRCDGRLWRGKAYWTQAAAFWRDLALALRNHPAVAGYNLINEPTLERDNGPHEHAPVAEALPWSAASRGTRYDLRAFYQLVIDAIRTVDSKTPIMRGMGWYAAADAFTGAQGFPPTRLVAAEFGCARRLPSCPIYLEDVLSALDAEGVHWAFYSFREDGWDAMDYELGDGPPPPGYWTQGHDGEAVPRHPNPVFAPIARRLAATK